MTEWKHNLGWASAFYFLGVVSTLGMAVLISKC